MRQLSPEEAAGLILKTKRVEGAKLQHADDSLCLSSIDAQNVFRQMILHGVLARLCLEAEEQPKRQGLNRMMLAG